MNVSEKERRILAYAAMQEKALEILEWCKNYGSGNFDEINMFTQAFKNGKEAVANEILIAADKVKTG